jgi:hypothetical protein
MCERQHIIYPRWLRFLRESSAGRLAAIARFARWRSAGLCCLGPFAAGADLARIDAIVQPPQQIFGDDMSMQK